MITETKEINTVTVKQYATDTKGQKVGAILDIKELNRIADLLEDLSDLKTMEDRISEPSADYSAYSRKRTSRVCV